MLLRNVLAPQHPVPETARARCRLQGFQSFEHLVQHFLDARRRNLPCAVLRYDGLVDNLCQPFAERHVSTSRRRHCSRARLHRNHRPRLVSRGASDRPQHEPDCPRPECRMDNRQSSLRGCAYPVYSSVPPHSAGVRLIYAGDHARADSHPKHSAVSKCRCDMTATDCAEASTGCSCNFIEVGTQCAHRSIMAYNQPTCKFEDGSLPSGRATPLSPEKDRRPEPSEEARLRPCGIRSLPRNMASATIAEAAGMSSLRTLQSATQPDGQLSTQLPQPDPTRGSLVASVQNEGRIHPADHTRTRTTDTLRDLDG